MRRRCTLTSEDFPMDPGSDFVNGEVYSIAHGSMQDAQPEQSIPLSTIRLHVLKNDREKRRLIAGELCRNAKAILDSSITITDVRGALTRFLRELRKSELELRLLNEEIEPLIHIEDLDQEFATNIDYEDEITHIMIRLYYQLKDKKYKTIEQCEFIEKLYWSKTFNEFLAHTELCYGTPDFKTVGEPALLPGMSPLSDFFPQKERENEPPSLATFEVQAEGALHLHKFEECTDITSSKKNGSSTPMTLPEAVYGEYIENESLNVPLAVLKEQDESDALSTCIQVMHETGERDEYVFVSYARKMAAARIRQFLLKTTTHCRKYLNNKTRDNDNRITNVQNFRKKRKPPRHYFEMAANEPGERT